MAMGGALLVEIILFVALLLIAYFVRPGGQGRIPLGTEPAKAQCPHDVIRPMTTQICSRLLIASVNAFFRLNPRAQLLVIVLLLIAGAIAFLVYRQTPPTAAGPESDSANLALGNPSNAIADPSNSGQLSDGQAVLRSQL